MREHLSILSLSSVFCCRAGSGYPNGYRVLGNSRGGCPLPSSQFVITYCDQSFLVLGTVCPRHPPYPVLPSCPLSRAFPYLQSGDAGGRRSAPAVCQSLSSADPTSVISKCLYFIRHSVTDVGPPYMTGHHCRIMSTLNT